MGLNKPKKAFLIQKPMLRVCSALMPLAALSIYLFGWRALVLIGVVFLFGITAEALFTFREGKPITSAVFVTCLIFTLSLPPTVPLWIAATGIFFGVAIGKMVFGGFGQNVFNPAMVGRCFIYITFPLEMTGQWVKPLWGGIGGFGRWSPPVDSLTAATPLNDLKNDVFLRHIDLFVGHSPGSLGETSALLILLGGIYIIVKKAAPWRLALSYLLGGMVISGLLSALSVQGVLSPLSTLLAGSFLFGAAFVVTEPISGAKTHPGQWIFGFMVGGLTVILRAYSNFSEGVMFSVLLMNAFVPIIDRTVRQIQSSKKASM